MLIILNILCHKISCVTCSLQIGRGVYASDQSPGYNPSNLLYLLWHWHILWKVLKRSGFFFLISYFFRLLYKSQCEMFFAMIFFNIKYMAWWPIICILRGGFLTCQQSNCPVRSLRKFVIKPANAVISAPAVQSKY